MRSTDDKFPAFDPLAAARDWQLHRLDSFEGLPEAWRDGYPAGAFARNGLPPVGPNVTLHNGWFANMLPALRASFDGDVPPVAYLHVNCHLYSATRCIFDVLGDRIVAGPVIVFDEYFNFDGWEDGPRVPRLPRRHRGGVTTT